MLIRRATENDVKRLVDFVIAAESAGTDCITYKQLFDLTDSELFKMLYEMIEDDSGEQELSFANFVVVEDAGRVCGGCSGWVEPLEGFSSGAIKAQMLVHFLGLERWKAATTRLEILQTVGIERDRGTIQLDYFGVDEDARGKGLVKKMIDFHLETLKNQHPTLLKAQIQLINSNQRALKAYQKAGFSFIKETDNQHTDIKKIVGGTGKILLEKIINE